MMIPAYDVISVTPHDTNLLTYKVYGLRATGAGNIVIGTAAGTQRTLAFAAGETRYVEATRVYATNTTATGIEGLVEADAVPTS